jgi:sugar lactone lactonase YvrE
LLALATAWSAPSLSAQMPAVVATSPLTLNGAFTSGPVVTDACGDLYVFESGGSTGVVEYQAGTGKVTTIIANTQGYIPEPGRAALYMDQQKKNLYFPDFTNFYTAHFDQLPIVNCVPGAINNTFGGNTGNLASPNYYYGTANEVAGDAVGDVFFTATQSAQTTIYEEAFVSATNTYNVSTPLPSWPNAINYMASDAAGNIYFADQTSTYPANGSTFSVSNNIYLLKAGYTAAPTLFAKGFNDIVGLSMDAAGNLYVADNGGTPTAANSVIYEIPNGSTGLVAANQYAVAAVAAPFKVAVDNLHNIYLSNSSGLIELQPSSALAPATAIGAATAGALPIKYVFNAAVTPTSISAVTGTAPSTVFSTGTGGCAVGTAYTATTPTSPAATSTCTLNATFTPTAAGLQTGAMLFTSSAGTVVTDVSGVGLAPQVTIDPGTVTSSTTTLKAPAGVTVDNLGNVFVTDSSANTLTKFAAGSKGVGTTVSTGSITLKGPNGVAVDNIGDIFIADSGNNRVVEIPVVKGVLTNASTVALSPSLKNPQGVAVDGQGNLYIADTGDNNLLFVPNISGTLAFASATSNGSSLTAPSAVTVDLNGNVFVAESGSNNDVLEFAAPFGTAAQSKIASGLSAPTGLAVDASGSLFVVNNGASSILRIPKLNGIFGAQAQVGSTLAIPFGVAIDANGNLYASDTTNAVIAEIQRVQTALQFGGWNVGATSTPLTGTVSSSGTQPVIFTSPSYTVSGATAAGFKVTSDACAGQTVQPGGSCGITATFTPPVTELNATETLTLGSNASNGTAQLQLVGTGANVTPSTLSLTVTPSGPLNAGQSVTLVATVGTGTNTATPGGSVKFSVNGTQVGTVAVTNKQATLVLKNGLPWGSAVAVSASYSGDVINYSGSTASQTEVVVALPDMLTLTASATYSNPVSDRDNAANPTGPSITLTATLTPSATAIIPNGIVTFYSGTTVLGIVSVPPLSGGVSTPTLVTTALRAGTTNVVENDSYLTAYNNIYAAYSADTTYAAAPSNMVSVTIVGANPTANVANPNTTGATFAITPTNPAITITSSAAASGSTTLSLVSYGGWQGFVNFTCSGLPAYAQCAPFPGDPLVQFSTPGAPQPQTTVSFIINTNIPPLVPTASSTVWWASGILGLCLLSFRRRLNRSGYLRCGQLFMLFGAVLLSLSAVLGVSGCSSTSVSSFMTPAGTSNVTVTVHAAQGTTTSTGPNDVNTPTFQIALTVQ